MIKHIVRDAGRGDGGGDDVTDYVYDRNGNLIESVITFHNGKQTVVKNTYDKKGNIIRHTFIKDFKSSTTEYRYDENGNLIEKIQPEYNGGEKNTEYSYELVYIPHDLEKVSDKTKDLFDDLGEFFEKLVK